MKSRFYLTLILLTLSVYIIISGCGGGSGTIQPSSLVTPVPNTSGNKAYITLNIKWPEEGMTGNFIISSGNNKEITASMPSGSHKIKAYVVDYTDKDPNTLIDLNDTIDLLASGIAEYPETQLALEVPLDSAIARHLTGSVYLPPFPVKIWAGAFGASGDPNDPNTALISTEQYVELEVGPQLVTLPLGDYFIEVIPEYTTIGNLGDTIVTANLSIVYPSPTPGGTSSPPALRPAGGKKIIFTIDPVASTVDPNNINITDEPLTTDPNGNCTALFKAGQEVGKAVIKAYLYDIPSVMNICNIDIKRSYTLSMGSSRNTIVKDGGQAVIKAKIALSWNPPIPEPTPYPYYGRGNNNHVKRDIDLSGKEIKFSVISYSGDLSVQNATTNSAGECETTFIASTIGYPVIRAEYIPDDQDLIDNQPVISDTTIEVVNNLAWEDDFERYQVDNQPPIYAPWELSYWAYGGYDTVVPYGYIDDDTGSKTLKLNGTEGRALLSDPPYEFKLHFMIDGAWYLPGNTNDLGEIAINHSGDNLVLIKYKRDGTLIDLDGQYLGNYVVNGWNTASIKFARNKLIYFINDDLVKTCEPGSRIPKDTDYLLIKAYNEVDVWYDNVKVYKLWGIPGFED